MLLEKWLLCPDCSMVFEKVYHGTESSPGPQIWEAVRKHMKKHPEHNHIRIVCPNPDFESEMSLHRFPTRVQSAPRART